MLFPSYLAFWIVVACYVATKQVAAVYTLEELNCQPQYVVIGGGCSGGIVASRLAQAGKCVVLLERGKPDTYDVGTNTVGFPIDLSAPFWHFLANPFQNPDISRTIWLETAWQEGDRNWDSLFPNAPVDSASGEWQYGFDIFGGGSMANAMVYNRGNENIFKSWGWDGVWERYADLEDYMGPFENSELVAAPEAFSTLQAFRDVLGWGAPPEGKLMADGDQSLVGFYDKSIKDGLRSSVPRNFFPDELRRKDNIAILLETRAERILFEGGRAKSVEYTHLPSGTTGVVDAQCEIVVSAGPYLSPHLLMKSGVGPREMLKDNGIDVVLHSPMVGQNYQNHLFLPLVFLMQFSQEILEPQPTFNGGEFIGHWYTTVCQQDPTTCDAPDMQTAFSYYAALGHYLPLPELLQKYTESGIPDGGVNTANLWTMLTQPQSRGYVELDPNSEYPRVHANFLSEQSDIDKMVEGLKKMREVAQSLPDLFEETILSTIYQTDEELQDYVKQYAMGQYHPAGTCKMGDSLRDSVVGRDLKAHGINGLRVVDSSIMPRIQNGNTAAPSMLIGYYGADLLLKAAKEKTGMNGDPHVASWTHEWFDYHGECDLVLVHSPKFDADLDLNIHVRTTLRYQYSYISSAAVQIGDDVLEVASYGECFLNGVNTARVADNTKMNIAGYPIVHHEKMDENHDKFDTIIGPQENITIGVFKDLVSVNIVGGTADHFGNSVGLLGNYHSGSLFARDGITVMTDDINAFGQEWQVHEDEPQLFQTSRSPQHPQELCRLPSNKQMASRRRLMDNQANQDAAKEACSRFSGAIKKACEYDVIATGDIGAAGAY